MVVKGLLRHGEIITRNMEFYVCNTQRGVYGVILLLYPWLIVYIQQFCYNFLSLF